MMGTTKTPIIPAELDYITMGMSLASLGIACSSRLYGPSHGFLGARKDDAVLLRCFNWQYANTATVYETGVICVEA